MGGFGLGEADGCERRRRQHMRFSPLSRLARRSLRVRQVASPKAKRVGTRQSTRGSSSRTTSGKAIAALGLVPEAVRMTNASGRLGEPDEIGYGALFCVRCFELLFRARRCTCTEGPGGSASDSPALVH